MVAPPRVRAGGSHSLYMLMRVMMAAGGNGCVRVSPGGLGDLTGYIYVRSAALSLSVDASFPPATHTYGHRLTAASASITGDASPQNCTCARR